MFEFHLRMINFFLQKTRVICFKLVLFRLYITYIYLHKKNTSKQVKQCIETAETVKNMVMTWCIIEHVLLHTIKIIFFDSVLKQKMTWLGRLGTYWLLRVFYYRLLYYSKKKKPQVKQNKESHDCTIIRRQIFYSLDNAD